MWKGCMLLMISYDVVYDDYVRRAILYMDEDGAW